MQGKAKTVLALDDDEDILKILKKILETSGYHVVTATNAQAAREILDKDPPHIILSDLNMPVEDGHSFIQSIRKFKQFQDIPLIVLSAVNGFHQVKKVIALGVSDYVIKPVQAPLLLMKIRKHLHNKDFATWTPPKGQEPVLEVGFECKLIELGETGYRINIPMKITPGSACTSGKENKS